MLNFLSSLKGKGYKNRLLNPRDEFYDLKFGVSTLAYKQYSENRDDPVWKGDYMPTSYKEILTLLRKVGVNNESGVIDYGCGLGRVVFASAHLGAKYSIGIEFDDELYTAAEANRMSSKFQRSTQFVHLDASKFKVPDDASIFFLFNPFGAETMANVIKNIESSIQAKPLKIWVIYYYPQFPAALLASKYLKLQEEWPEGVIKYTTQFWSN